MTDQTTTEGLERRWSIYQPPLQTAPVITDMGGDPPLRTGHSVEVMPVSEHAAALSLERRNRVAVEEDADRQANRVEEAESDLAREQVKLSEAETDGMLAILNTRERLAEAEADLATLQAQIQGAEAKRDDFKERLETLQADVSGEIELLDDLCREYLRESGDAAEQLAQASDRLGALLRDVPEVPAPSTEAGEEPPLVQPEKTCGDHDWEWKNVHPARPHQQRRVCTICGLEEFVPVSPEPTPEAGRNDASQGVHPPKNDPNHPESDQITASEPTRVDSEAVRLSRVNVGLNSGGEVEMAEVDPRHLMAIANILEDHNLADSPDDDRAVAVRVAREILAAITPLPRQGLGEVERLRSALGWALDWIECEGKPDGFDPAKEPENWNEHFEASALLRKPADHPSGLDGSGQ